MSDPASLLAWRDTLADLGVMGLVPPPFTEEELAALQAPVAPPEPRPAPLPERPALPSRPEPRVARPAEPARAPEPLRTPRPAPAAEPEAPKAFVPPTDPMGNPPAEALAAAGTLEALEACTRECMACPLGAGRLRYVFGEGDPGARMMFIGEGPGKDEDLQGRPFVGKAGELLDKMIASIGLRREQVYIANVVKCRPPDNRTPLPDEAARCLPILRRQIELIRPKVIVTLGATPLRELLGVSQGITRMRGQWQQLDQAGGIPVMPTFHPAYVLRQYTQDVRRAVYQDLLAAKAWLEKGEPG